MQSHKHGSVCAADTSMQSNYRDGEKYLNSGSSSPTMNTHFLWLICEASLQRPEWRRRQQQLAPTLHAILSGGTNGEMV